MQHDRGAATPRVSLWVTGMRENLSELPDLVDLAARVGVDEVYLQRMVYGFGDRALAREDQTIYHGYSAATEAIIAEAERRAANHAVSLRGADALSPRESILERIPDREPWRACSRPLRLAYVTAEGTALPCCIAPFTDAPYESIMLGNLRAKVWLRSGRVTRIAPSVSALYSSSPPRQWPGMEPVGPARAMPEHAG